MISLTNLTAVAFLQGANLFCASLPTLPLSFPLFWFQDGPCLDIACKLRSGSQKMAHHLFYGKDKKFRQYLNNHNCLQTHNKKKKKNKSLKDQNKK